MAQPVYSAGAIGGLLASQSLAGNKNVAAFIDASNLIEAQVTARVTTGGSSTASTYTKNEGYFVYGQTTLSAQASATATSITVVSATGIAVGQKIIVGNELHTVSAVSGATLTVDAIVNTQANGSAVYLIESTPTYPGVSTMGGTASTTYVKTTFLATAKWIFLLTNTDGSNAVTVELTQDNITSFS